MSVSSLKGTGKRQHLSVLGDAGWCEGYGSSNAAVILCEQRKISCFLPFCIFKLIFHHWFELLRKSNLFFFYRNGFGFFEGMKNWASFSVCFS